MYTRCQGCHTVHPVNAAVLAQGGGKYRCGKCHKICNALEALFDEWPKASEQAFSQGELPELGLKLTLGGGEQSAPVPGAAGVPRDSAGGEAALPTRKRRLQRIILLTATFILTIIITLNLARFFQHPLLDEGSLQSTLIKLGMLRPAPQQAFRSPDKIELVNRELKPHPVRPGVLSLTATIVNRADRSQAYPDIYLTLLDIHNRELAHKLFKPGDYLARSAELRSGMRPHAYLTFSLDVPDPGEGAVGFELQFR